MKQQNPQVTEVHLHFTITFYCIPQTVCSTLISTYTQKLNHVQDYGIFILPVIKMTVLQEVN